MIIETSDNRFYQVRECENPDLQHNWIGNEVKRKGGQFIIKNTRAQLVRKAALSRVVEG